MLVPPNNGTDDQCLSDALNGPNGLQEYVQTCTSTLEDCVLALLVPDWSQLHSAPNYNLNIGRGSQQVESKDI